VQIDSESMRIGCQFHSHDRWKKFDDDEIAGMADDATKFWNEWKDTLLSLCDKCKLMSEKNSAAALWRLEK
jgi:hypothetical protein